MFCGWFDLNNCNIVCIMFVEVMLFVYFNSKGCVFYL